MLLAPKFLLPLQVGGHLFLFHKWLLIISTFSCKPERYLFPQQHITAHMKY